MLKIKIVALVAGAGLLAAACGGVGGNGGDNDPGAGSGGATNGSANKNLKVAGFGSDDEIAKARLDKAREDLGLTLNLNKGAFDEQQFLTAVAAGDPPDVLNIGRDVVGSYAARGALQPIDKCIEDEDIDLGQYREQALAKLQYDGKTYGIPEFYNYPILVVNNRVAKEAGVDPASIDTGDWAALIDVATKLTKQEGGRLTRLGFDARLPDASSLWPAIHGVEPLGADGVTAKLDDPATIDVYTNYKKLVDAQGGWTKVKSFKDSWDFFGGKNPFVTDQVGAMVVEQWYLTVLAETAPTKIDISVVPIKGKDGKPVTIQLGGSWVIPNKSKNFEGACKFAKLMTSVDAWLAAANSKVTVFGKEGKYYAGTYTGNKEADAEIFGPDGKGGIWKPGTQGEQFAQFDPAVAGALELQANAVEEPASPIGNQFNTSMLNALNRILQGEQDVAASLERAQGEVDDAAAKVK